MRVKVPIDIVEPRVFLHQHANRFGGQAPPAIADEDCRGIEFHSRPSQNVRTHRPVGLECRLRLGTVGHHAFLATFAEHAEHLRASVYIAEVKTHQLADAQAGAIQQLENGAIALQYQFFIFGSPRRPPALASGASRKRITCQTVEEPVQFLRGKNARYSLRKLGSRDKARRVLLCNPLAQAEFEESPESSKLPRYRRFLEAPVVERADEFADDPVVNFINRRGRRTRRPEKFLELLDVAAVFTECMGRHISLVPQVMDKLFDRLFHEWTARDEEL